MSQRPAIDPAAAALLIVLCAVWGAGQVAIKVGNQGISPLYHAAIRSAGAALLVWGWSAWSGISLGRRDGTAAYGATIATLFALEFVCSPGTRPRTSTRTRSGRPSSDSSPAGCCWASR